MLGSKGLLPPTDANEKFRFELLRSFFLPFVSFKINYNTSAKCTFRRLNTSAPIPNSTTVTIQKYIVE